MFRNYFDVAAFGNLYGVSESVRYSVAEFLVHLFGTHQIELVAVKAESVICRVSVSVNPQ